MSDPTRALQYAAASYAAARDKVNDMSDAPGVGHNQPPSRDTPLLMTDGLGDKLRELWKDLYDRKAKLLVMVDLWVADHAHGVTDEEDARMATDTVAQVLKEIDAIDKSSSVGIRADVKGPLIRAGRIIDGIFKGELADPLREAAEKISGPLLRYGRDKSERLRQQQEQAKRDAEAQARQAREASEREAQERAREAEQTGDIDGAIAAEQAALEAAQAPVDVPKVVTRAIGSQTHGNHGTMSNVASRWVARIVDPARVPRQYCVPSQPLVDAAMRASRVGDGPPTIIIEGVRFELDQNLRVRR